MKRFVFITIFLFSILVSTIPEKMHSQEYSGNDISVSMYPEFPGPNENVKIDLASFSVDLRRASISWHIDGKLIDSGIEKKSFSFQSPSVGKTMTVSIFVYLSDGTKIEKKITLTPQEMDILWEATRSYVPPFYRGKALPAPGSTIRVSAMPSGKISANNTVYEWKRDFKNIPSVSGNGKQSFTFTNSYLSPKEEIEVLASSIGNSYNASRKITISTVSPKTYIYQYNDVLGILYNSVFDDTRTIRSDTLKLAAVPYFFSPGEIDSRELSYSWKTTSGIVPHQKNKNIVSINNTKNTFPLSLKIENSLVFFQDYEQEINIQFR